MVFTQRRVCKLAIISIIFIELIDRLLLHSDLIAIGRFSKQSRKLLVIMIKIETPVRLGINLLDVFSARVSFEISILLTKFGKVWRN